MQILDMWVTLIFVLCILSSLVFGSTSVIDILETWSGPGQIL